MGLFPAEPQIPGLILLEDFLSSDASLELLQFVDSQPWLSDLSRRVQHFGSKYDYRARNIDLSMRLGDLPAPLNRLAQRLQVEGLMTEIPDQVIVNEYQPGQGIAAHIDCEPCFGPQIATVSLGDSYPMIFTHSVTGESREIWLPTRSVCVMSGESRTIWKHEIAKRKSDIVPGGGRRPRLRRVSLTFRKVII